MADMTAAEKAVLHIVRRVQSCPDFAWLMMGTESLALCFEAIAARKGEPIDEVRKRIEANAASLKKTPEIVELREQIKEYQRGAGDTDSEEYDLVEEHASGLVSQVRELLWQVECGQLPLTMDRLQAVLDGKPVTHLV